MIKQIKTLPKGWVKYKLGELGYFKTSSIDKKINPNEKEVKLINYMDVYRHRFIDNKINYMLVTANDHEREVSQVEKGDILFTPSSETPDDIGHSAVVFDNLSNTLYSYHLVRLKIKKEISIDLKFRGYFCNSRLILKHFEKLATGVTRFTLSKKDFEEAKVIFPKSIKEQKKIAEILNKVDKDIEKTDQIIEGIERIKNGLMQELLTKGIGHKKFKKTELGKIPEEWEVVKMKDSKIKLIDGDRGVNYPKLQDFSDNDYCLFLNNKNIKNDRFVFNESSFISKEKDEKLRKGKLKREDIILTSRGTVGNVAYYNSQIPFENIRINSGMLILRHGKNYDPLFLYKLLSGPFMKQRYKDMGTGSAQPQLPIKSLEQIKIPLLLKKEQKQIAEILSSVDNKIDINKQIKNKLTQLKKGLMQDLLSGRVRVKNL